MPFISKMKPYLLLPVLTQVICDNLVPSSPEIFYGGFVPMLLQSDSEMTENKHSDILPEERNSRQMPLFEDTIIDNKRNSRFFRFQEGDARNQLKKSYFSKNIIPVHKDNNPKFPLGTPFNYLHTI